MANAHYLVVTVDDDGHVDVQSAGDIDYIVLDHNQLRGDVDGMVAAWRDASDYPPGLRQHIQRTLIQLGLAVVTCVFCRQPAPRITAHWHSEADGWVGDECCWDERLRATQ